MSGWSGVRSSAPPSVRTARSSGAGRASRLLRRPTRDLPLDVIAIEPGEHLQLLELVAAAAERAVEVRELFARGDEARRQRGDRLLEGALRLGRPALVAKTECPQVVGIGHLVVESRRRGASGDQRGVEIAVAIARQRQLVADARRGRSSSRSALLVDLGGAREALQLVADVAQFLERARGHRVEDRGRPEVAGRGFEVAAPLIGLAAPQVGEHRVGPQRDGAAVGLDGGKRLLVAQGRVAAARAGAVVAVAGRGLSRRPTTASAATARTTRTAQNSRDQTGACAGWTPRRIVSERSGALLVSKLL